ncbi:MAG TPA: GreA/GreB family elongation factor, partial [Opitutaceae bacterium]|nr:GreA/GreB family elongation factor [Opitutaceae bacterium]
KSQLEKELARARVSDFKEATVDQVSVGTIVEVRDTKGGKTSRYTVLGAWDSNPDDGVISYKTPLGLALMGRKPGDHVKVKLGAGEENYEISRITRYVDAAK